MACILKNSLLLFLRGGRPTKIHKNAKCDISKHATSTIQLEKTEMVLKNIFRK